MPIASVKLIPGLNTERTPALLQAGYTATQNGRFKDGLFQKIGGWKRFRPNNFETDINCIATYRDSLGSNYTALGSESGLHIVTDTTDFLITPRRAHTYPPINFSTTIGSNVVKVIDTSVTTIYPFDAVIFYSPVTVGGIILSGMYQVDSYVAANTYNIVAQSNATATVNNGGAVMSITTVLGSSEVTITFANHGLSVGKMVAIDDNVTSVGGLLFYGIFKVFRVIDANNFTVIFNQAASSNDVQPMGGAPAMADLYYYLSIGPIAPGVNYGVGLYDAGPYNIGLTPTVDTGTPFVGTDYSLVTWGDILVAAPSGRPIHYWDHSSGFQTAQVIGNGPKWASGAFLSTSTRILVCYNTSIDLRVGGAGIGMYRNPLLIQWSDQQDFTIWTPTASNMAGNFVIPSGTSIVGGISTPTRDLILTDVELWGMTFTGYPYAFSISRLGANCGLVSKYAVTAQSGKVYWQGPTNFFVYDGSSVQVLPCSVWDAIFQDMGLAANSFAMSNSLHNEIWFFSPSAAAPYWPDRCAKYNTVEQTWDILTIDRRGGIDVNIGGNPLMSSSTGAVYYQETTADADGGAINCSFETGYFTLSESLEILFIDRIIPDFRYGPYSNPAGATIDLKVYTLFHPNDTPRIYGPYTATATSPEITCRIRGRLLKLRGESNDMGSFWRLGNVRFRFQPDGRR